MTAWLRRTVLRPDLVPLGVLVLLGGALRVITMIGFPQPLWTPDSQGYIVCSRTMVPLPTRPCGYSVFLRLLAPFHSVTVVVAVQHVLGVGAAVAIYLLLVRRRGVRPIIAALAVAPILLDAYIIGMEHYFLSDSLFGAMLVAATVLLLWWDRLSWPMAAVVGLVVGLAGEVRTVGLPLIALFLGYLLLRQRRLWVIVAFAVAAVVPIVAYSGWAKATGAPPNSATGVFMYSRVAIFADCAKIKPTGELAELCPTDALKGAPSSAYIWSSDSPIRRLSGDDNPFVPRLDHLGRTFAEKAILAQPLDYLWLIMRQSVMAFKPGFALPHFGGFNGQWYTFRTAGDHLPPSAYAPGVKGYSYDHGHPPPSHEGPMAGFMKKYQRLAKTTGPLLAIAFVIGLVGLVRHRRELGGAILLPWALALSLLIVPIMTSDYDFRYVLPVIPFAFLAAALSFANSEKEIVWNSPW